MVFIGVERRLEDHLANRRSNMLYQLLEDVADDFGNESNKTAVIDSDGDLVQVASAARFAELIGEILSVLRTDSFKDLETSIRDYALEYLGFDPKTDMRTLDVGFSSLEVLDIYRNLELRVCEYGFESKAVALGQGFQSALVLALLRVYAERRKKGAVFLIEEPEAYLHPQMQRALAQTLRQISESNQVILTTHSPHFTSIPDYSEVLRVERDESGSHTRRSDLPMTSKLREKLIKELDPERAELFFASRVILVEGDTEKLALPEYANRMGISLDQLGVTIVEAGGKRSLPLFLDIIESFKIPCAVLYDRDSSDFGSKRKRPPKEQRAEDKFNEDLEARAKPDGSVSIYVQDPDYETELRDKMGEGKYQAACCRYPSTGKPTKHRLIAREETSPIPDRVFDVLSWASPTTDTPGGE